LQKKQCPVIFQVTWICVRNWQEICLVGSENFECAQKSPKILIKGGTVVNADHQQIADVYIKDGKFLIVAPDIKVFTSFLPSFLPSNCF
jgi:hypothetical protein